MHSDLIKMILVGLAAVFAIGTLSILHVLMVPKSALPQRRKKVENQDELPEDTPNEQN